jgi:hypothetical protein
MRQATHQQRELARRLFTYEIGQSPETSNLAEIMERACEHLHERLALFIGASGFHALFTRALRITKAEFPFLQPVEAGEHPICLLEGSREAIMGQATAEVREGFAAVLANFIWLLVTFIGEDLALRWVQEVWSEVPLNGAVSASRRGKNK